METKFNFNSQVCTDINQSSRLSALGLKKETADMYYYYYDDGEWHINLLNEDEVLSHMEIPAWSLHRLCILAATPLELDEMLGYNIYDYYDNAISHIESLIKEGYFNKEYLED